jgi:beta-lactamase regulating signal transducer with metallopeptidase domain
MDALSVATNAIGWTLIHSLWLGALAAAAYALPAARLRNQAPQLAYGWGLTCLLLLVLSLGLIFAQEFDRLKDSADAQAIARAYAALPVESGAVSSAEAMPAPAPSSIARGIDQILPLLVLAWALAVAVIGAGLVRSQLALRRLVAAGVALPNLAQPVIELAERFGVNRPIAVVSSAVARVPFVIGHFAPVIVLPLTVATGMPWPQLRLILAHEIAHLRRADYLINWLQIALEVLLFFHPAVRWLSEELRRLREACCDDMVVAFAGGRGDYTRALLALEESRHEAPLLAPSAVAGGLLWRVQRIAGRAPNHRGSLQKVVLPAVVASLLVLTLAGGVQIRPGSGPRDLVLPQASLLMPSLLQREAPATRFAWDVQLPPLNDAEIGSEPQPQVVAAVTMITTEPVSPSAAVDLTAERRTPAVGSVQAPSVPTAPELQSQPADPIQPLHAVRPVFPHDQRLKDGPLAVVLEFGLAADGAVRDIKVAQAPGAAKAFVAAATQALSQWTYPPGAAASGDRLRHRFEFRDLVAGEEHGECTMLTSSRVCLVDARPSRRPALLPGERCKPTTGSRLCRR